MDPRRLAAWRATARTLCRSLVGPARHPAWDDRHDRPLSFRIGRLARAMDRLGIDRWTPEASLIAFADCGHVPQPGEGPGLPGLDHKAPFDPFSLVTAIRIAHAVTTDGPMTPFERAFASHALGTPIHATPDDARDTEGVHAGFPTDDSVQVAFPWRRPPRRESPHQVIALAHGVVQVPTIAAVDAPIVARLAVTEGGWLDLRSHQGGFLRPVLAPGSWRPMPLAQFRRAVGTGEPWADNPFVPLSPQARVAMGLSHYARPMRGSTAHDETAMDAAWSTALASGLPLAVVDGIVHRDCPAPVLTAVVAIDPMDREEPDEPTGPARMSWRLGPSLSMTSDMSLLGRRPPAWAAPDRAGPEGVVGVPLGNLDDLAALGRDWLDDRAHIERQDRARHGHRGLSRVPAHRTDARMRFDPTPVAEVLHAATFPRDPSALLACLSSWIAVHAWRVDPRSPAAAALGSLSGMAAIARRGPGEPVFPPGFEAAIEGLCTLDTRCGSPLLDFLPASLARVALAASIAPHDAADEALVGFEP